MAKYGFHDKLLRVDLTQEKIEIQNIPDGRPTKAKLQERGLNTIKVSNED